jgi:hypothetical protein
MRRRAKYLALPAVILLVGCLAAGCSTAQSAISSLQSRTPTSTAAPTTAAPTTAAPTTAAPTPTAAPTTAAPTTAAPTTAQPTQSATKPAATVPPSAATPSAGSGTGLLWLWILLGAVVLIGLITWITLAARRRKAATADWRSKLIDAYAQGSALHDAMNVAEMANGTAAADPARWFDIQRRADDFAQTLYTLREAAPDPDDGARIADTLVSLQAVRSAMDAERAPGGAGPYQAEVVRSRLYAFESSLRALRSPNEKET